MKKQAGFTLLELIIVMALVALILGLSTAFFAHTLPSSKFNAAVRDLVSTIRYARSLAQADGENQTVTIDLDAKNFGIDGRGMKSIPPGVNVKVLDYTAGEIVTGKHSLVFPAIGGAEGGTIVLWDTKKSVTIALDPIVGSVVTKSHDGR